jgi:hypothetical protein
MICGWSGSRRTVGSRRMEEDQGQKVNTSEMGHHNERCPKGRLFRAASDFYHCLTLCYITRSTGQRNEVLYPAIIDIQDDQRGNLAESVSLRARCKVQVHRAVLPALDVMLRSAGLVLENVCFGILDLDRASFPTRQPLQKLCCVQNTAPASHLRHVLLRLCYAKFPSHRVRPQRLAT